MTRSDGKPSTLGCNDWLFDGVYNGDLSDGKLSLTATIEDYNTDAKPPGSYNVEIEAVADLLPSAMASTSIIYTLKELCNPLQLELSPVSDVCYSITEEDF